MLSKGEITEAVSGFLRGKMNKDELLRLFTFADGEIGNKDSQISRDEFFYNYMQIAAEDKDLGSLFP